MQSHLITFLCLFGLSYLLTALVRFVSKRIGFVSNPDGNRWNKRVVALGGGVAIFLAIVAAFFWKGNSVTLSIFPAFVAMFLLGFWDDIWGTSPSAKLIVQVMCAAFVVSKGYMAPLPWTIPAIAITVIWIVGMTNSLNLIDNIDGLASGCTAIAALAMAAVLLSSTPALPGEAMILIGVAAASLGFLAHNYHPARIFMGDAGSLPLGFLLAVFSTRLQLSRPEISPLFSATLFLLILVVPLLDTFLVIVSRTSAKRSITVGGRDHTSHRLVALGLSERKAVGILYGLGALGAIAAYLAVPSSLNGVLIAFSGMMVLAVLFGIFLLEIAVYPPPADPTAFRARENFPIHIQNLVEIALDVCAVSVCWLAAHLVRFHDTGLLYFRESTVIPFLPFVIVSKVFAVLIFRLYRGIWRSIMPRDIYQIFKAALLGSLLLFAGLYFATRMVNISRIVLVLDGLLCFFALVGTRTALIGFRRWTRRMASRKSSAVFLGEASLLPWVEEAIDAEKGIEFKGHVSANTPAELEKWVREHKIDVIFTSRDLKEEIFLTVKSAGVLVRRVKAYLT